MVCKNTLASQKQKKAGGGGGLTRDFAIFLYWDVFGAPINPFEKNYLDSRMSTGMWSDKTR